jgi:hypothetical protein
MAEITFEDVAAWMQQNPQAAQMIQGRQRTPGQGYQELSPEYQGQLAEYSTLGEQAKLIERLRARGVDKENTPMPTTTTVRGMPVSDMGGGINAGLLRMQGASDRKKADGLDAKNIQKKIDTHGAALKADQASRKLESDWSAYNAVPAEPAGTLPRQDPIQQWQGNQYDPATGANRELMGEDPTITALRKPKKGIGPTGVPVTADAAATPGALPQPSGISGDEYLNMLLGGR